MLMRAKEREMRHMPTRLRGIRLAGIMLWSIAFLILTAGAGCNPYHTPQTIAPATELTMSEKSISIGPRLLKVPHGWDAESLDRFDNKGRPLTVFLARPNAHIRFEVDKRPLWGDDNVGVRETSTTGHAHVRYKIISTQEPSGDDTPAHLEISAYFKDGDMFWCMEVGFATPVSPDLLEAVKYIDAIGQEKADVPEQ